MHMDARSRRHAFSVSSPVGHRIATCRSRNDYDGGRREAKTRHRQVHDELEVYEAMKGDDLTRVGGRGGSARTRPRTGWRRRVLAVAAIGAALSGVALATLSTTPSSAGETPWAGFSSRHDGLGIEPGKIKHVWLIILENKSYDASFTGLNNNTYLWQTLPSQGVVLQNYYGTGHFSLDNYVSMVSGQATQPDDQADCPNYDQ